MTFATALGSIATIMSTKTRDAKEWLEGGLERMNSRARNFNESTVVLRVGLDELNENSRQALHQAIMVASGLGLNDVADSMRRLSGVLPRGPFCDPAPPEDDDENIIDAEFEVCDEEK